MQQTAPAYLIIQTGNRWTDILRLQPEQPVLVGRSSDCQIVVKDERVSRKHAQISPQNGEWVVQDLGSRNGTQVDDQTIVEPHPLVDGESIAVGGCLMTFSIGLKAGLRKGPVQSPQAPSAATQATVAVHASGALAASGGSRPTIVNRIARSQWSSEALLAEPAMPPPTGDRKSSGDSDLWSFFYRLIADLVIAEAPEAAAQVALDRLLDRLGLTFAGIVTFDAEPVGKSRGMAVLAARQGPGGVYHRISDFLVDTVTRERQAVLARNVQDDSKLSVARASGQHEVLSVICAPLRARTADQEAVIGLLHVYTAGDERMLTETDLQFAVAVADNLAIALTRQQQKEQLARSLESSRRRAEQLQEQLHQTTVMVGQSPVFQQVQQAIARAAPTNATVLVRGESGVGKELVARAIHQNSDRHDGPFICLNCAALAPTLLESELFGHEKGAFTGATEKKLGKFEAANGGTLLLDEVGEMYPELQAKFLRVLEGHPFERLGGHKPIQTDVRVIAATNRDLEEAVKSKDFRADLYYRLRVVEIFVPPLRDRKQDIPLLVEHFMEQLRHHAARRLTGIAPAALELLTRHNWPGNVRELRNVLERAIVLGSHTTIDPEDLSLLSGLETESQSVPQTTPSFRPISLAELEQQHILAMLDFTDQNKTKASQLLGIERSTLDRKLKRYS